MCGEHVRLDASGQIELDSPPRVRGARQRCGTRGCCRRLTPACAGSTTSVGRGGSDEATHPRVCGEHFEALARSGCDFDSPPRVRGARGRVEEGGGEDRLTPACAGSTCLPGRAPRGASTHPRVCGEHTTTPSDGSTKGDSPPRVRGARFPLPGRELCYRLTPACAGSTPTASSRSPANATHPRVCGEHRTSRYCASLRSDSPPRVRGAPATRQRHHMINRLTPACAGSTAVRGHATRPDPTHPRVCGEHCGVTNPQRGADDSPPRVRGARGSSWGIARRIRLTPACAGSTDRRPPRRGGGPTHPRVCGEHDPTAGPSSG